MTDDPQETYWFECPHCGPVDPYRRPMRMSLQGNSFEPEWEYFCPECGEEVGVKS